MHLSFLHINFKKPVLIALIPILVILALLPLQARATEPAQGGDLNKSATGSKTEEGVMVLRSSESEFTFDVLPPPLELTPVETSDGQFDRVRMADYGYMGLEGAPDLPQKDFYIALPPGAEPVLALLTSNSHVVEEVAVLPGEKQLLIDYDTTQLDAVPQFETTNPIDDAVYGRNQLFPVSPITLGEPIHVRDQRVVPVTVNPVQVNPLEGTLTVFDSLRVQVSFEYPNGRPEFATSRPEGPTFEKILADTVLNYEESINWRQIPESIGSPQTSPCMDANAFRITVEQTGIYEITHADLAAQGFPSSAPSAKLRMCYEDQEISIKVEDGSDGTFESGDSIVFYGEAIKTQETESNIYWLTYSNNGTNGQRMAPAVNGAAGTTPGFYSPLFHLEEDSNYRSIIPTEDLNDHWYWGDPLIGSNGDPNQTLSINFDMSNRAPGTYDFPLRVEVWGYTRIEDHEFEVKLNNISIGIGQFTGSGRNNVSYLLDIDVPSTTLQNGTNTLSISALPNDNGHYMLVNWIELEPRRDFVAQSNRLAFEQENGGPADYTFNTSSFSPSNTTVDIFDVSDPFNPTVQSVTAAGGNVTFNRNVDSYASYQLVKPSARLNTVQIEKDTLPGTLLSSTSNQADYIIITDPALDSALTPLRNQRSSQGLIISTVFVQDIFDEFNYGIYSTDAIRNFLEYAFSSWSGDREFVLLAGESSYDHRDLLGLNGVGGNRVPVYLRSGVDSNLGEAAADNQYVAFGNDDLADMLLGRLPAKNTAELTNMVNKILAYENGAVNDTWRERHLFVSDNGFVRIDPPPADCEPDPAGDFFAVVNDFISNYFPAGHILSRLYYAPSECYPNFTPPYPVIKPYYSTGISDMQIRLVQQYGQGNQFVVYTGHSGTQQWGQEEYINVTTASTLNNGDKLSINLPMTCLEGIYHFPQGDNLSETMVKSTIGGAVASYAPTGLQVQQGHDFLLDGFYEGVFTDGDRILGQAIYKAKLNLATGTNNYQDLQDTYMLLGDPALQIPLPGDASSVFIPVVFNN